MTRGLSWLTIVIFTSEPRWQDSYLPGEIPPIFNFDAIDMAHDIALLIPAFSAGLPG